MKNLRRKNLNCWIKFNPGCKGENDSYTQPTGDMTVQNGSLFDDKWMTTKQPSINVIFGTAMVAGMTLNRKLSSN